MATTKEIADGVRYTRQVLAELMAQEDLTEHEEITNELVASVIYLAEQIALNLGN